MSKENLSTQRLSEQSQQLESKFNQKLELTNHESPYTYLKQDEEGVYAGVHLLIEVCDASYIDNERLVAVMLEDCAKASGATVLHTHTHLFTPNGGVSGIVILAESHISIHTWPEIGYAAMDVFMCGDTVPEKAITVIKKTFATEKVYVKTVKRGKGLI